MYITQNKNCELAPKNKTNFALSPPKPKQPVFEREASVKMEDGGGGGGAKNDDRSKNEGDQQQQQQQQRGGGNRSNPHHRPKKEETKTQVDDPYGSTSHDDEDSLTTTTNNSASDNNKNSLGGQQQQQQQQQQQPRGDGGGPGPSGPQRRSSTRSIKPVQAFTPTSPEDPAVKATLLKSGIGLGVSGVVGVGVGAGVSGGGGGGNSGNDSSSSDCSVDEKDSSVDGDDDDDNNSSGDDGDNDDASNRSSEQQDDDGDDDDGLSETPTTQSGKFIKTLYDMIEESHTHTPQAICWSDGGKSFIIDPDQKQFQQIIDKTLGYRSLQSFHRQLNYYGWTKSGLHKFVNPVFFRGVKPKYFDLIRRREASNYIPFPKLLKMMERKGDYRVKVPPKPSEKDEKNTPFPRRVWAMIESVQQRHPDIMRWEKGGKAFYIDKDHSKLNSILKKEIHLSNYKSIHRRLNKHGWAKPSNGQFAGLFYHPVFSRDMADELYDVIKPGVGTSSLDGQIKEAKKIRAKLSREKYEQKMKAKATGSASNKPTKKAKKRKASKADLDDRGSGNRQQQGRPAKKVKASTNRTSSMNSTAHLSEERQLAEERLMKYKKVKQRYNHWTVWSIPPDLKNLLEALDVNTQNDYGNDDDDSDVNFSRLLCRERMPSWLNDGLNRTNPQFEELVLYEQRQRETKAAAQEEKISPPKGRALPTSKFNTPTNKWLTVKVGDRVDIFWAGDDTYYSAVITKQQGGTSYFFLIYEEDGQSEWLDLSREEFEILRDTQQQRPTEISISTSRSRSSVPLTDRTPRKDNRSGSSSAQGGNIDDVLVPETLSHLAPYLRYKWDGINLDCSSSLLQDISSTNSQGNANDNKADGVSSDDASKNIRITALDVLHDIRSLRKQPGVPPSSGVSRFLKSIDDVDASSGGTTNSSLEVVATLRKLRDDVTPKASETSTSTIVTNQSQTSNNQEQQAKVDGMRRLTNKWSREDLIENMVRVENQVSRLCKKEQSIMDKLRTAKLIPS